MPRVWNLGNTTVRNPNRIELGLKLFANEFQGNVHGGEAETRFAQRLVEEDIVESRGTYSDLLGRKWRSVLVKLGFATDKNYRVGKTLTARELVEECPGLKLEGLKYELTPVGKHLLEADTTGAIQDTFLRQLVRYELPNPIGKDTLFTGGQMKPLIYLLQVLYQLKNRSRPGLNKVEIGAFLQLFVDHTDEAVAYAVQRVLDFRTQRGNLTGQTAKREFDQAQLQASGEIGGVKARTLLDYADTTMRYTKMTGLVTMRGSRLVLRDNKMSIIKGLLSSEPLFSAQKDPLAYLADFYSGTSLPTDDVAFALEEVQRLAEELQKYQKKPLVDVTTLTPTIDIQELENARYKLLEQLSWSREEEFAREQTQDSAIREVLEYLDALGSRTKSARMGIVDRPTYLEWVVWRGFLAINEITIPTHLTRRFPVDEDLLPRHPAPGGGADLIFEFDDYILVVEVTLTGSSRQVAAEGEPVRRHVADVKETATKEVYALFIAPTVDNNTAETFRIGVWYRGEQEDYVNIVPLTLTQFRQLIETLLKQRYTPREVRHLIDRCLTHRNVRAPDWKRKIEQETNHWITQLTQ